MFKSELQKNENTSSQISFFCIWMSGGTYIFRFDSGRNQLSKYHLFLWKKKE